MIRDRETNKDNLPILVILLMLPYSQIPSPFGYRIELREQYPTRIRYLCMRVGQVTGPLAGVSDLPTQYL